MNWGLISSIDAGVLMKTIDLAVLSGVSFINITEVGIYSGSTGNFLREYAKSKGLEVCLTGIDNNKDGEKLRFEYDELIIGNSNEVYNQIPDESQHLIFIDALHTFPAVVADFFCYTPKVKKGGFLCFHDTGVHLDPLSGWQGVGDKNDPDFCLGGVRKALESIKMFTTYYSSNADLTESRQWIGNGHLGWELIFDEADPNDTGGGICCFRRI